MLLERKLKIAKIEGGYWRVSESQLIFQKRKVSRKFYNVYLFFNDTLPFEPSSQASPIPRIRIWSIKLNSWEYSRKYVCDVRAHKTAMRAKLRTCMTANRVADFTVEGRWHISESGLIFVTSYIFFMVYTLNHSRRWSPTTNIFHSLLIGVHKKWKLWCSFLPDWPCYLLQCRPNKKKILCNIFNIFSVQQGKEGCSWLVGVWYSLLCE